MGVVQWPQSQQVEAAWISRSDQDDAGDVAGTICRRHYRCQASEAVRNDPQRLGSAVNLFPDPLCPFGQYRLVPAYPGQYPAAGQLPVQPVLPVGLIVALET